MKYLETSQIIPMKGMSYTMYEIEGEDKILRMLTFIPDVITYLSQTSSKKIIQTRTSS